MTKVAGQINGLVSMITASVMKELNVTGLLDPTLKCIDHFRLRQQSIPSTICIFKVSKKTLEQCVKSI